MSRVMKEAEPFEEIKAECEGERRQMIISYLSEILGHQHFEKYKKFASLTKIQHYQELVEGYLSWTEQQSIANSQTVWGFIENLKKNFFGLFNGR